MINFASVGLAAVLSLTSTTSATFFKTEVSTIPPETVKTSTFYDSASHKLTITCDIASRGLCRFTVVDGARTKEFMLRPKTRSIIAGVSDKARVCAVGRNPGLACNLVSVGS
jgi:hypothetical protein